MGRRANTVEVDATVEGAPPPEEAGGEGAVSLFDATSDARVRVIRRDDRTMKMITHGYFPPTVSEEDISNAFGGGFYRAQLVIPDPASGSPRVKRSRDFNIPGAYKPPAQINRIEDVGPNGNSPTPAAAVGAVGFSSNGGGDDLMAVLKAGIINTLLDVMNTSKESRAPTTDPMLMEMVRQQGAVQTKIIELMLAQSNAPKEPAGDSKKDILDMMARMKELVAPAPNAPLPTDPMQMFNNMLDTFKSFREAAEDVAPQGNNADPILGSIPKLVEVVAEQHQMNKAARENAVTHVPVPSNGGVAHMPQVGVVQPEIPMWRLILKQQGARLMAAAVAKADPDVVAGASILFAPPAVREALLGFFHREENEVIADIFTEIPSMADHREWLAEFVNCAQQRLFPDEFVDDEPETTEEPAK